MANKETKKVTKVDKFEGLISKYGIEGEDKKFLLHEIELLKAKKANKKPTKEQETNEKLKAEIIKVIGVDRLTVSAVWRSKTEWLAEYSNQKFSALMNALVEEGKLGKLTDKRVSYFYVIDLPEEVEDEDTDEVEGD
jgi:hypothetical protein